MSQVLATNAAVELIYKELNLNNTGKLAHDINELVKGKPLEALQIIFSNLSQASVLLLKQEQGLVECAQGCLNFRAQELEYALKASCLLELQQKSAAVDEQLASLGTQLKSLREDVALNQQTEEEVAQKTTALTKETEKMDEEKKKLEDAKRIINDGSLEEFMREAKNKLSEIKRHLSEVPPVIQYGSLAVVALIFFYYAPRLQVS